MTATKCLVAHDIRQIAVESFTDPRTVEKVIRGEPVKELSERRIRAAMNRMGLGEHLPSNVPCPLAKCT